MTGSITGIHGADQETAVPHSIEAEQQLLGALLNSNELYDRVSGYLTVEHFYDPVHARIYERIVEAINDGGRASPVTLKPSFATDEGLKELGGPVYLVRLAGSAISENMVSHYAEHIVEMSERRRLVSLADRCSSMLRSGAKASDAIEEMESDLLRGQASLSNPRSMSLLAAATKALKEMHNRYQNGSTGISTGLADLDRILGGLHRAEHTLVGGSTSMGKTAFGTWLTYNAAKAGIGVGFASIEMGEGQFYQRFNSIDSLVPYRDQRRVLSESAFQKVVETAKDQESLPVELFNSDTRTIHAIFSEARKLQRKWRPNGQFQGLGLLVIDYIQLIRGKGTPLEILAEAAIECKNISKSLDIPVVALAQVDRNMGARENKIPTLSDLRGSGDLEFSADNVIFCHRPEYYLERDLQNPDLDDEARMNMIAAKEACKNTMDLFVAKQRMGEVGSCRVGCDIGVNRFWDLPRQGEVVF